MTQGGSNVAIRLPLEVEGFVALEESDELVGREDGAELDVAFLLDHVESLAGFQAQGLPNFLWDYDLKLWR